MMKPLLAASLLFGGAACAAFSVIDYIRMISHIRDPVLFGLEALGVIVIYAGMNLAWLLVRREKMGNVRESRLMLSAVLTGLTFPFVPLEVIFVGNGLKLTDKLINAVVGLLMFVLPVLAAETMYRLARSKHRPPPLPKF